MNEGFENSAKAQQSETDEKPVLEETSSEMFDIDENIEADKVTPEDTPEEHIEALEEGIRLTELNKATAQADMERWRGTNTTEPSHFENHLPEIRNRINRAEHSITSSKLDIDLIQAASESPEQEDEVIKGFVKGQILENKTTGLREKLSSFDAQETDYSERMDRNHRATDKLQTELSEINTAIESGSEDTERLKLNRRDVLVEMHGVSDRYEALMSEKSGIDVLGAEREATQSQIDEIVAGGVADEELPKSIEEDPDFASCLKEADSYASQDSKQFAEQRNYNPQETAIKLFRDRFPQKSSYYERNAVEVATGTVESLSAEDLTGDSEHLLTSQQIDSIQAEKVGGIEDATEVSKDKTINAVREAIEAGSLNTEPNIEKLKAELIIDTKSFYEVEPSQAEQSSFEYVDTARIIGRPNAANYEDGWAHEYNERVGRIGEIVEQINNPDDENGIERIFHTEDQPTDRIKLASYEGPAGPIYSVFDGTHRVAGVKASGLEKMPAEIFRTEYPLEKTSNNVEEIADWQDKIDRGFVAGSIETIGDENGERSILKVESEVLPWIRAKNQNDIFKINQIYEQQYPGSLEQAGFPPETLTDKTALWAYMDGNFDQWKQLQEENDLSLEKTEEIKMPKSITTAKGSVYTYLEDGTTQRFKSVEGDMKEPQDILTFIPQIERIKDWEHFDRLPDWIKEYDNDQVMEMLASDYIHNPKKSVVLTNESNQIVRSNAEAAKAETLLLQFVDAETNQTEFALPVSSKPEVGDTTYDARYFEKDGKQQFSSHIGNAVTSIEY
jgi:hypothetical protein